MQAVILAAGKSTRAYPLTLAKPKPLLKVANKTLLEHNLDNLSNIVNEAIIVVGYKKEMIKNLIKNKYKNIRIRYVEQKKQLGTAHALSVAEPHIKGRFALLMGDDIYSKKDIKNCVRHRYSILAARVEDPGNFGVITEKNGILTGFVEKPDTFISNLANTAFYSLDKKIFGCIRQVKKSKRNEFELPDAIRLLSKKEKVHCVESSKWLPVAYAWDLLKADRALRKGKSIIGKNSKISERIINSSIGDNCVINGIVKNSIIMDNSFIEKGSVVEDSVIGENVYFKGRIISKNNAHSIIKGKKINAGRLGAIVSDNSKLVDVEIRAGCKISPGKIIKNKIIECDA